MTRDEFYQEITEWDELIEFCNENELVVLEDVCDAEAFNEKVNHELEERVTSHFYDWDDILEMLDDVTTGYDHYLIDHDDVFDSRGLDDYGDFNEYKDTVAIEMDRYNAWDEESDEEDPIPEPVVSKEDLTPIAKEPISFDDFMNASLNQFTQIKIDTENRNNDIAVVDVSAFINVDATAS